MTSFGMTIFFIALVTVVGAFVRRRSRDRCLRDFTDNTVTMECLDGTVASGKLRVENTGLEFIYPDPINTNGDTETSFIMYKSEYPKIAALMRFHDKLSPYNKKQREQELARTYHPSFFRRTKRKTLNAAKTVRDSLMEVINLLISQAKRVSPAGGVLTSQDKYVSKMKTELTTAADSSYEPLIEKYIGHKIILEVIKNDQNLRYCGVLKDYTKQFIEIMDVDYKSDPEDTPQKADIVLLRQYATVRHFAE